MKRKSGTQRTAGRAKGKEPKTNFKDKLVKVADDMQKRNEGNIGLSAAHRIWNKALDGYTVTKDKFVTLRHIL